MKRQKCQRAEKLSAAQWEIMGGVTSAPYSGLRLIELDLALAWTSLIHHRMIAAITGSFIILRKKREPGCLNMSGITIVFNSDKNLWCRRKTKIRGVFWKGSLRAQFSVASYAIAKLWSHSLSCSLSVENGCRTLLENKMFMQQCCRVVTPHDLPARPHGKQKLECVGHGWGGKSRLHFMSGLISWAVASHYKMARDGIGCIQTAEDPWGRGSRALGEGQGWAVDSLWVSSTLVFYISGVCNGFPTMLAVIGVGSDYTGLVRWGTF